MTCPRCQHANPPGAKFCEECATPLARTCAQCGSEASADGEVLPRVRASRQRRRRAPAALRLARELHAQAPRREDPDLQGRARGRAQAGDGALRRPQGLDGAARRPRSRGGAQAPRSRARAHDGGRPPLRGHRQPGDGRRDHGAVRRAARPRGPRGAGVLRGAPDAGVGEALRRGRAPLARRDGPDPRRAQLRRGGRALHRQRPAHGLHGRRPDHPPRGAHGAAGRRRAPSG